METIRLSNLAIGYRQKGNTKTVATGINATINGGELTCLIGANGTGKSTLLRTLSAFLPKLGGTITINGKEISSFTNKQLAKTIGVVLTGRPDVQNITVTELVGLGRSPYTGFWGTLNANDKAVVQQALTMTGISHLAERMVQTLSDGERQKAMIAKALAQQTPVIFLDEPTAFLDYPSKVEMMQLLQRLSRETGKTIFLSTHDLEIALQIADRLWLMDKDKGICVGTPVELAAAGTLSNFINREGINFNPATRTIQITELSIER